MKYALTNTDYRGETGTVEELYLNNNELSPYFHTHKLSETRVWDTFNEAVDYANEYGMNSDHKVVKIKEKDLFEARLTGK